eukprot:6491547-Amphidinium_carterae.1
MKLRNTLQNRGVFHAFEELEELEETRGSSRGQIEELEETRGSSRGQIEELEETRGKSREFWGSPGVHWMCQKQHVCMQKKPLMQLPKLQSSLGSTSNFKRKETRKAQNSRNLVKNERVEPQDP